MTILPHTVAIVKIQRENSFIKGEVNVRVSIMNQVVPAVLFPAMLLVKYRVS